MWILAKKSMHEQWLEDLRVAVSPLEDLRVAVSPGAQHRISRPHGLPLYDTVAQHTMDGDWRLISRTTLRSGELLTRE